VKTPAASTGPTAGAGSGSRTRIFAGLAEIGKRSWSAPGGGRRWEVMTGACVMSETAIDRPGWKSCPWRFEGHVPPI